MNKLISCVFGIVALIFTSQTVLAQYIPIPDEQSGTGCPGNPTQCSGYLTLQDMNNRFGGIVPISPIPVIYSVASLPACSVSTLGQSFTVTNNDANCVTNIGSAPVHSSCIVGTNCYSCRVACAETGSTTYSFVITGY